MPNWISNHLKVSSDGSEEGSAEFKQFEQILLQGNDADGEPTFELEKFIPTPKELIEVIYPCKIIPDEEYKVMDKTKADMMAESTAKRLIETYGFLDWYNWRLANWGCKWDVSDYHLSRCSNNVFSCIFLTPWSPPECLYEKLKLRYPHLIFDEDWVDIG